MCLNLTFFPVHEVKKAYEYIKTAPHNNVFKEKLVDFDEYFCKNFLFDSEKRLNRKATFDYKKWNCFERIINGTPRTTN
jgi:hypothetical protein